MLHYEYNNTLFMFNQNSKHNKEANQAEGVPVIYPDTPIGRKAFPYRFGSENIVGETADHHWHQEDAATDRKWNGWTQNWNNFLTRDFNPESGGFGVDHPLGITCNPHANFTVEIANISLVGPNGVAPLPLEDFRKYQVAWEGASLVDDEVDGGKVISLNCGKSDCPGKQPKCVAYRGRNSSLLPKLPGTFDRQKYTHVRYFWRTRGFKQVNHSCPCMECMNLENRTATTCNPSLDPHPLDLSLPFDFNGGGGFMGGLSVTNAWWPRLDNNSAFAETRPSRKEPNRTQINSSRSASATSSYGRLNMTGVFGASADLAWERRVVLSASTGVMVVVDTITPAKFQNDYLSGVLWKFLTGEAVPQGKFSDGVDWISLGNHERSSFRRNKRQASTVFGQACPTDHADPCPVDGPNPQRLLVKLGGNGATEEYGVVSGYKVPAERNPDMSPVPQPPFIRYGAANFSKTDTLYNTIFSKRTLVGGRPNVFVSVFTPHLNKAAAPAMAKATTIVVDKENRHVAVHVALEGGAALDVELDPGDQWSCK